MVGTLKGLYEETLASQIKVWDGEIEHLDARADILMAQIEDRYYSIIKSLRSKERELETSLAAMRAATEDDAEWMEARNRVNCVANEMKEAIQHAVEEIEPEVLI
jgi:uncharacterized protein with NRDE domain